MNTLVNDEASMAYSCPPIVAKVETIKVPASLTESGLVPPELNLNVKAEPPLEKVPLLPNGLVRVRTLPLTLQPVGDKMADAADREQEDVVTKVIDEGKVTVSFEAEGIA